MDIILKSKRPKKATHQPKPKHRSREQVWPQDFVGRPHDLAEIVEAKINSQTCDEDDA